MCFFSYSSFLFLFFGGEIVRNISDAGDVLLTVLVELIRRGIFFVPVSAQHKAQSLVWGHEMRV
jgi:hypothetical protein